MIDFGFSLKTLQASRFYLLRITVHKFKPDRVACYRCRAGWGGRVFLLCASCLRILKMITFEGILSYGKNQQSSYFEYF